MNVEIRDAEIRDAPAIAELFYNTILNVNVGDYTVAQVEAWADPAPDPEMWERRMISGDIAKRTFVAVEHGRVVGFAEFEGDGHLDTLYVHHEFQGRTIASRLLDRIEGEARRSELEHLYTEASITAEPFFRRRGFSIGRPQLVEVRGHTFRNFVMEKVDFWSFPRPEPRDMSARSRIRTNSGGADQAGYLLRNGSRDHQDKPSLTRIRASAGLIVGSYPTLDGRLIACFSTNSGSALLAKHPDDGQQADTDDNGGERDP
jgi:putative acetyltransferase